MGQLVVRGASIWRDGAWHDGDLWCRDGYLVEAQTEAGVDGAEELDGSGLLAAPGFVDLQCNGALGVDLASEPERLWELAAGLPRWGVTAWLPTIVTTPPGVTTRALAALAAGPPEGWVGAVPLGLHLEGPFLSPAQHGAHRADLLQRPSLAAIHGWTRDAGVRVVTLAPELDGAHEMIEALAASGVVVSLGHSDATAAEATAAVDAGATWVTHLFNAMSPLLHREPGLPGVALTDDRVRVGLIADGIHVHPATAALAQQAARDRLTLVSDSIAPLGMPLGRHRIGEADVMVDDAGPRLPDGTLAGSILSMDRAVRNLVDFAGCDAGAALDAASRTPAAVLSDDGRGRLEPGRRADVVVLTRDLQVVATIVGGELVHDAR